MTVFGETFARAYDAFQAHKDYTSECDLIGGAFARHGDGRIERVLDLGCGTGGHALLLARRGYHMTGVDLSADMVRRVEAKAAAGGVEARWLVGDLRTVDAGRDYDACLVMFSTLGYMLENDDVEQALRNVRRHLRPGGVLLLDVWYGPAVLAIKPSERVAVAEVPGGTFVRAVSSTLDTRRHRCTVDYRLWALEGASGPTEVRETHVVRYFFPLELELLLSHSGFSLASMTAFPDLDRPPDDGTWNAFVVARCL